MVLLQPDPFLSELTSMYERSTEKGSVWVTLKRSSLKCKAVKNKMESAGETVECRCLIRATDGKKHISTSERHADRERRRNAVQDNTSKAVQDAERDARVRNQMEKEEARKRKMKEENEEARKRKRMAEQDKARKRKEVEDAEAMKREAEEARKRKEVEDAEAMKREAEEVRKRKEVEDAEAMKREAEAEEARKMKRKEENEEARKRRMAEQDKARKRKEVEDAEAMKREAEAEDARKRKEVEDAEAMKREAEAEEARKRKEVEDAAAMKEDDDKEAGKTKKPEEKKKDDDEEEEEETESDNYMPSENSPKTSVHMDEAEDVPIVKEDMTVDEKTEAVNTYLIGRPTRSHTGWFRYICALPEGFKSVKLKLGGQEISVDSMKSLAPDQEVNDVVIDKYLSVILSKANRKDICIAQVHFATFLTNEWKRFEPYNPPEGSEINVRLKAVKDFFEKPDNKSGFTAMTGLLGCDKVSGWKHSVKEFFIPINVTAISYGHWIAAHVNARDGTIRVHDTLRAPEEHTYQDTMNALLSAKDHQRFQASYATILKAHMSALKKRERKDKKKTGDKGKDEGDSKKNIKKKTSS